jgi:hypothetical protein
MAKRTTRPGAKRTAGPGAWIAAVLFLLLALYHIALTVSTILGTGVANPYADESRTLHGYLTLPFSSLAAAPASGAKATVPALLRWSAPASIHVPAVVQLAIAWMLGAFCFLVLVRESWRSLAPDRLLAAAATGVAAALLFWNANVRMFLHESEAVRLFGVAAALTGATLAALHAAESERRALWWSVAILLCAVATLASGIGIAAFAALAAVAIVIRAGFAPFAAIVAVALAGSAAFLWTLPGEGWRELLPRDLSSAPHVILHAFALIGGVVAEVVSPWMRDPAMLVPIAAIAGALAVVPMALTVLVLLLRRHFFTRLEALAVGFHVFGIVANALIAVARAPALLAQPAQLFADAYLFWSCIAWLGLGLFLVARLPYAGPTGRRMVLIAIALFCVAMVADGAVQATS